MGGHPHVILENGIMGKIIAPIVLTVEDETGVLHYRNSGSGSVFPMPRRGDPIEAYLKRWRDKFEASHGYRFILDRVLDDYRLHADTGSPLDEDVHEGE